MNLVKYRAKELNTSAVTFDQLMAEADLLGVSIIEQRLEYELCGLYDHERHTIILDPCLSDTQRLCTLAHELNHAKFEDTMRDHWLSGKAERRTRKETAFQLINPFDFRQTEMTYEGECWLMAADLGVTMQVVEDYHLLVLASHNIFRAENYPTDATGQRDNSWNL